MTIEINTTQAIAYGEQLMLNVIVDDGDGRKKAVAVGMSAKDGRQWRYVLNDVDSRQTPYVEFFFSVMGAANKCRREQSPVPHRIDLNNIQATHVKVFARWNDVQAYDMRHYTTAFTQCLEPHSPRYPKDCACRKALRLLVHAPQLRHGERLVLVIGEGSAEGRIANCHILDMTEHSTCEWLADINAETAEDTMTFRLAAKRQDGSTIWEEKTTRHMNTPQLMPGGMEIHEIEAAHFDTSERRLSARHMSMLALRDGSNCGIGDFGDLERCVHTVGTEGVDMLCLHPLSDTTATHTNADATPYSSVSVFALHLLFLDVRQLAPVADDRERLLLEEERQRLCAEPFDYMATVRLKQRWMRCIFCQEGDHAMRSAAFRRFFADNERWLVPYAQYSYLRDAYATPDFHSWPSHQEWTEAERGQLRNPRTKAYKKLAYIYYSQYVLHQQLQRVHKSAVDNGIVLQADLTANLNPSGCDMWCGQRIVDTDEWWKRRLEHMSRYFDACRIADSTMKRENITLSSRLMLCK